MFSWLNVIKGLMGFISGPLANITNKIIELKIKQADAKTEQMRIEVGEQIAMLQAQRDVLIAESAPGASMLNAFIRLGFAFPCMIVIWQLTYDNTISFWIYGHDHTTPRLSDDLWGVIKVVIGFYFVTVITTHTASILKR